MVSFCKSKKNLDDQLLPGLESKGVPSNLKDSVYLFGVNDFNSFQKALNKFNNNIAAVIISSYESAKTDLKFLKKSEKESKRNRSRFYF